MEELKHIFLINEGDLPEDGSVYAEQILYEKLFRWKDVKALESQLAEKERRIEEACDLMEGLNQIHPHNITEMFEQWGKIFEFIKEARQ